MKQTSLVSSATLEKNVGPKKYLDPEKYLGPEKNVGPEQNVGPEKNLGPEKIYAVGWVGGLVAEAMCWWVGGGWDRRKIMPTSSQTTGFSNRYECGKK